MDRYRPPLDEKVQEIKSLSPADTTVGITFCCFLADRSKAEMDLKELSETVQQKQGAASVLTSPKRQIRSRFQLNLDKTIESCKAQLGQ